MFRVCGINAWCQLHSHYVKHTTVWTAWLTQIIPVWQRYDNKCVCVNTWGETEHWKSQPRVGLSKWVIFRTKTIFLIVNTKLLPKKCGRKCCFYLIWPLVESMVILECYASVYIAQYSFAWLCLRYNKNKGKTFSHYLETEIIFF